MPHMVNGIGTTYYGRRNATREEGTCEHCGKHVYLDSYDTGLYFVFLLIPIVPLGRKRILRQCGACTRHAAIPLGDWVRRRNDACAEALAKYRAARFDPEAAKEVLGVACAFRYDPALAEVAPEIAANLGRDFETMKLLGVVLEDFLRPVEAEAAYRAALAVKDDEEVRERLAVCVVRLGRLEEGRELLRHVVEREIPDRVGLLLLLVQGYHSVGDHARALETLEKCIEIRPDLEKDKEVAGLRKRSRDNLKTGRKFHQPDLAFPKRAEHVPENASGDAGHVIARLLGRFGIPSLVVLVAGGYLFAAYRTGQAREVALVNGLGRPYVAKIDGAEHSLPSHGVRMIRVPEGEVVVEVPELGITDKVMIETDFWTRPLFRRHFVLNPDRTAPVLWERVHYSPEDEADADGPEPEIRIAVGRMLHPFDSVDYYFEEFPNQISLPTSGKTVAKERVGVVRSEPPTLIGLLPEVAGSLSPEELTRWLQDRLSLDPDDAKGLFVLEELMESEAFLDFLRPRLADRPVRLDWHRAYQTALEKKTTDAEVVGEYRALLAADPENRDLMYLLARCLDDRAESDALLGRSVEGEAPSPYGCYALANRLLSDGEFEEAPTWSERAIRSAPDDVHFQRVHIRALELAGRYADAATYLGTMEGWFWLDDEIRIHALLGDDKAFLDAIDKRRRGMSKGEAEQVSDAMRRHLKQWRLYLDGDLDGHMAMLGEAAELPATRFRVHIAKEDAANAEVALKEAAGDVEMGEESSWLVLHLLASRTGADEIARNAFEQALAALRAGDRTDRRIADALENPSSDPEPILRCIGMPEDKRLLLATFGLRRPEHRDACFDLARRLNADRTFPHHLVKEIVGEPPETEREDAPDARSSSDVAP